MLQVWGEDGVVHPVTAVLAGPATVTQVKTAEKDGYVALQMGIGERKAKTLTKAEKGHFKELGNFRYAKEFRPNDPAEIKDLKVGDKIDASVFSAGDSVTVSGISKGKGFQGVVKRHGFAGGSRTHGQKHSEREPGSIGGGARAGGRVAKGMRMAGRMGGDRVTVKNLKVIQVNVSENLLLIEGAIPGKRGTLVEIRG